MPSQARVEPTGGRRRRLGPQRLVSREGPDRTENPPQQNNPVGALQPVTPSWEFSHTQSYAEGWVFICCVAQQMSGSGVPTAVVKSPLEEHSSQTRLHRTPTAETT